MNKLIEKYNNSDSVGIITSFPSKNGEIARANAISRYSFLLVNSFPKTQRIIIFCEKRSENETAFELSDNLLIVPTYSYDSIKLYADIIKNIRLFSLVKDFMVQFEFSIFGGKKVIPAILLTLLGLKILGKNTTFVLHQVVTNLNELSGHLGLSRNSFKTHFFNLFLKVFYVFVGIISGKIVVHDELLKARLSEYVNPNKIEVIPHAIGDGNVKKITPKLIELARKQFGFSLKDKVVAVYGYRSWYKGTDWIVKTVKELSDANPEMNLKLLVAGGVSPTLKTTASYRSFDRKLKSVIKKANGSVRVTGFLPEKDVWKVFAASNVIAFPYRTRMSASGAFSLTLAYKKPFVVSNHFAVGSDFNFSKNSFDLNTFSFEKTVKNILGSKKLQKEIVASASDLVFQRSWKNISDLYLSEVKSAKIKLDVNKTFQKAFRMA